LLNLPYIRLNTAGSLSLGTCGPAFFLRSASMRVSYTKTYLDIPGQLALLQPRGVSNPAKAASYLERIGYYRLSGY
jgi:hypothetical protein